MAFVGTVLTPIDWVIAFAFRFRDGLPATAEISKPIPVRRVCRMTTILLVNFVLSRRLGREKFLGRDSRVTHYAQVAAPADLHLRGG